MVAITSFGKTKRSKTDMTHPACIHKTGPARTVGRGNLSQLLDENGERAGQRNYIIPGAFARGDSGVQK